MKQQIKMALSLLALVALLLQPAAAQMILASGRVVCDTCLSAEDGGVTYPIAGAAMKITCTALDGSLLVQRWPMTDQDGMWQASLPSVEFAQAVGRTLFGCQVQAYRPAPGDNCTVYMGITPCSKDYTMPALSVNTNPTWSGRDQCYTPVGAVDCRTPLPTSNLLATLRSTHPRLIVNIDTLPIVRASCDPANSAQSMLPGICSSNFDDTYALASDGTLNTDLSSRNFLDRIAIMAGAYLINGDRNLAAKARAYALYITTLDNNTWTAGAKPSPGYMTAGQYLAALSYAYDWLNGYLSSNDKTAMWNAVLNKAFLPSLQTDNYRLPNIDFLAQLNNNIGVNALYGWVMAALAFAERDPVLCEQILRRALVSVWRTTLMYHPSGAWTEGTTYLANTGMSMAFAVSSLEAALGTDFGILGDGTAMYAAAYYRIYTLSPVGLNANFADAQEPVLSSQWTMYAAKRFNDKFLAEQERVLGRTGSVWRILWLGSISNWQWGPGLDIDKFPPLAGHNAGYRVDTVSFQTAWQDSNAGYLFMRAGQAPDHFTSHQHLDLGSVIFETNGERWLIDLGSDDYDIPNYFREDTRYTFYRARTEGHNTLAISTTKQQPLYFNNQPLLVTAPITTTYSDDTRSQAIMDLSDAYPNATSVMRGVMLLNDVSGGGGAMFIQDEIVANAPGVDIVSMFHTRASVQVARDGRSVQLTQGDDNIVLIGQILSPADATFSVITADPTPLDLSPDLPEDSNAAVVNIIVRPGSLVTSTRIVVYFQVSTSSLAPPSVVPLARWVNETCNNIDDDQDDNDCDGAIDVPAAGSPTYMDCANSEVCYQGACRALSDTTQVALVPLKSTWYYQHINEDVPDWQSVSTFSPDSAGWESGPAPIATSASPPYPAVTQMRQVFLGGDVSPTGYFIKNFVVNSAAGAVITSLDVQVLVQQGAVVWLNGVELVRLNMPDGNVGITTWATVNNPTYNSGTVKLINMTLLPTTSSMSSLLKPGTNRLAVEMHKITQYNNLQLATAVTATVAATCTNSLCVQSTGRLSVFKTYSAWSYKDDGQPAANWMDPSYDDSSWSVGMSPLGFYNRFPTADQTIVSRAHLTTTYFRKTFTLTGTQCAHTYRANIRIFDSFPLLSLCECFLQVLYLNGIQALRVNMPANSDASTFALNPGNGDHFVSYTLAPGLIKADGPQVLAVEVHAYAFGAPYITFDMEFSIQADAACLAGTSFRPLVGEIL
eukprot:jgi/Chlat1/7377/Chrsp6S07482